MFVRRTHHADVQEDAILYVVGTSSRKQWSPRRMPILQGEIPWKVLLLLVLLVLLVLVLVLAMVLVLTRLQ